jgi:hypothetical protein
MKGGISAGRWDDAVFTSSNAVRLGLRQRRGAGRARIFAIGPGMAAAAAATGWPVEPLPGSFVVESLAETLLEQWVGGRRVLLLGAVGAREVPHELLRRAGAGRQVDPLPGWSRRKARGPPWSGRWPSQAWTALSLPVAARLGASGPFQERSRLPPRWWLPASGRSSPALLGTPGWSVRWSPRALDPGVVAALEARFGRARENGRQP